MILSAFDNMLKAIANDKTLMSDAGRFNSVQELMTIVGSVQALARSVENGNMNDMLIVSIKGKLMELESIITMFGNQKLAAVGIMSQGGQQQPMPFMPNMPMHNQNLYYPTMGQQMFQQPQQQPQQQQQMGQQFAQPQQQPQQQMSQPQQQPDPVVQEAPAPAPQVTPQATPQSAPQPVAPRSPTPAPTPAATPTPQPTAQPAQPPPMAAEQEVQLPSTPPSSGGEAIAGFSSLPGMGGGGGNDKAAGRDYILKLLNGE